MNIEDIIKKAEANVNSHRLENEGEYSRWLWQNKDNTRKLGINEYGCADAVNILYTIGKFPDRKKSDGFIKTLKGLQNSNTGLFVEETHHEIHTTAHCVAALELFDEKPEYPLKELLKYKDEKKLVELLENALWKEDPWNGSHRGAGIYAALVLAEDADEKWQDTYFNWLWEKSDPETGLWCMDSLKECEKPLYHSLACAFHYLFNHEYAKRPLRYPDKLVDTCISMYKNGELPRDFGYGSGFLEVDWVYTLSRAMRQTPHRFYEGKKVLENFAEKYIKYLNSLDWNTDDGVNDLHCLFGVMCALAELQQALPGLIKSKKTLRLVLDRRPFI